MIGYDYLLMKQIMELLKKNGEMTPIDISRELKKAYPTIRRYIDFMEKEGMIVKNPVKRKNRVVKILVSLKKKEEVKI